VLNLFFNFSIATAHSPVGFVVPKDGSIIKKAPEKMEIVFTAPAKLIKVEFSKVTSNQKKSLITGLLGNETLTQIKLNKDHLMNESRRHIISLPKLEDGIYKTAWRALSEDGHAIKGEFIFEVSPEGSDVSGAKVKLLIGEGQVKRVRGTKITIKHGPLGELMPAMTMEFNVSDKKVISNFKRGDKVRFQVNKELELIKIELN
jgi:methionine-rich copper-binding protein CopC/Cu/Ag efflux protein CusF